MLGKEQLKTTGEPRQFETGAQRDSGEGKLKMSLIPVSALESLMERYRVGADNYGKNNWMNGMPFSELYDSTQRHLLAWWKGQTDEDHLGAALWNICGLIWEENNKIELDDRMEFPQ